MADFFNRKQKADLRRTELSELDNVRASATTGQRPAGATGSRESKFKTNIKPKTSSFADVLSGNSSSEKKKSGTLLGESIYDDDDDFKDLKFDFKALSDKPKDDWKSKQIKDEDERIAKLKRTADILYGKTTPEHGIYWKGDTNNSSSVEKDNNIDETKTNTSSKISDDYDDEEDILDLFYPTMKKLKSKNKTSSLNDEIKSQTSSDPAKVSDNDEEDDILDLMYPSMANLRRTELSDSERVRKSESRSSDRLLPAGTTGSRESKFKTGIKSKNDNEPTSEIKDEIEKATSLNLPKFAPEKEETRKTTAKNEKTEFDSGMKIPDFADKFDEDFDTDETEDEQDNETEEQENDFPSEISNKKKKSDKDGIITGGAAGDKDNKKMLFKGDMGHPIDDKKTLLFGTTPEHAKYDEDNETEQINGVDYPKYPKTYEDKKRKNKAIEEWNSKNSKSDTFYYNAKANIVDNINNNVIQTASITLIGNEATEFLRMAETKNYMNTDFAKQHKIYKNYNEVEDKFKNYIEYKIKKSVGNNKADSIKGIYIDSSKSTSKKIGNELLKSKYGLTDKIYNSYNTLEKGYHLNTSIKFKGNNLGKSVGKADLLDIHINKRGNLEFYVADVYDFPKYSSSELNQIGYERQKDNRLTPYFSIIKVVIPREKLKGIK